MSAEFHDGLLWFELEESSLTLGVTDLGVLRVGDVQKIDFPSEGDEVEVGESLFTVDGSKGKLEVITPATGIVTEVNEKVEAELSLLEDDPVGEGWLVKLSVDDPTEPGNFAEEEG